MSKSKYYASLRREWDPWCNNFKLEEMLQVHTEEDLYNNSSIWHIDFLLNNLDEYCCLNTDKPILLEDYLNENSYDSSTYNTEVVKLREISKEEYLETLLVIKLYKKILSKF